MSSNKVILFYGHSEKNGDIAVFSNFYPCEFVDKDGLHYFSSEQYMMKKKADTFHDEVAAQNIINLKDPAKIKGWGRKVQNYDEAVWASVARDHVYQGCLLKFSQSRRFRNILLRTGDAILAEASPFDPRWGIGMALSDPMATNPVNWKGTNWLGQVLMRVRETIKNDPKFSSSE